MTEKYENTSRVPLEHGERSKEVSKFKFEKKREEKSLYCTVLSSS